MASVSKRIIRNIAKLDADRVGLTIGSPRPRGAGVRPAFEHPREAIRAAKLIRYREHARARLGEARKAFRESGVDPIGSSSFRRAVRAA